jgi:hypothetical protein
MGNVSADAAWEEQRCPNCGRFPAELRPDCPSDCPERSESRQPEAGDSTVAEPPATLGPEEPATDAARVADTPAPAPSEPAPVNPDEQGQADPIPGDATAPGLVDRIESAVSGVIEGFRGDG